MRRRLEPGLRTQVQRQRRRRPQRRRRATLQGEAANAFLMEGMLIAVLLVLTASVLQFQGSPPSTTPSREPLQQSVEDVLRHLAVARDPDRVYSRMMDRAVAEALHGDPVLLERTLERVLPTGALYNVFLDNGAERLRLRFEREPAGESVGASRTWSPAWETVVAVPTVAVLDGERAWLEVQAMPLHRSLGLRQQAGVEAEVTLELPGGDTVVRRAFAPLTNVTGEPAGVRLSLVDSGGNAVPVWRPGASEAAMTLRVEETQGRPLPAGSEVELRLPSGFFNGSILPDLNPGWSSLAVEGASSSGLLVRATIDSPLDGSSLDLTFNASRPAWGKVHRVDAWVSDGLHGQAGLVVVDALGQTRTGQDPLGLAPLLHLPRATPWAAPTEAALVLAYEEPEPATVDVVAVTLAFVGGASLRSGEGIEPGGTWTTEAAHLNWTGRETLAGGDALAFRFRFQADAPIDPGSAGERGLQAEVDAEAGANATLAGQRAAGVFTGRAAPANATLDGPPSVAGGHAVNVTGTHRGGALRGAVAYEVSALDVVRAAAADVARGADGSWLEVRDAKAPLAGSFEAAWDLQALVDALGLDGATSQFRCYLDAEGGWSWEASRAACDDASPLDWQFRQEVPKVRLLLLHPVPTAEEGSAFAVALEEDGLEPTGTATTELPGTSLLGTHPVLLEATLTMAHSDGSTAEQVVRLLGAVDVHREGQDLLSAPFYRLAIQAWMPDWG